jgi:hypothetical protein
MLTTTEAEQIARDCIRQATGFGGPILPSSVLKTVGVVDDDMREAVNDDIVTDNSIGVLAYEHTLGPNDLTFTINSLFFELRDEISSEAQPKVSTPAPKGKKVAGAQKGKKNTVVAKKKKEGKKEKKDVHA